jgi:hypothetical protein
MGERAPLKAGRVGNWHCVPFVYACYCAAATLALVLIPETRDLKLEDLDRKELRVALGAAEEAPSPIQQPTSRDCAPSTADIELEPRGTATELTSLRRRG